MKSHDAFDKNTGKFDFLVENYKEICYNIQDSKAKYRNSSDTIRLMAVTKTVDPQLVNFAIGQGIDLLGENRVQEYLSKRDLYDKSAEVHFIGHLQSNKVKYLIDGVSMIQSVDSFKLASEINRLCGVRNKKMDVLVEVNIGEETSKSGVSKGEVISLIEEIAELENVRVKGLMAVPPIGAKENIYSGLQDLFESIKSRNLNADMEVLSIGMSGDYKTAVKYGSTLIRIGTKLFGARKYMEV